MKAINVKTEYMKNPVGIGAKNPRIMWNCDGGQKQTAYCIDAVVDGKEWSSGKVESGSMHADFGGALKSRSTVRFKIRLWDENGNEGEWSDENTFEMGLLEKTDWQAKWISGGYKVDKKKRYPVDCFKKEFDVKNVEKARLYITACGLYEAHINGQRVGNFIFAPGYTDYNIRVQYQTYDVSALIKSGSNALTVELADGWYRGSCGAWGLKNQFGVQTKLLAQLEMVDKSGNVTIIGTDKSWAWSSDGKFRFSDNKDGEIVEAWRTPSYNGCAKETEHKVIPSASNNVPIVEHETFKPTLITTPSGKKVLDFGQNIQGYISFSLTAKKGQEIFMRFGELIDKDGEFTQKNIQCRNKKGTKITPLQQVEYYCKDGVNDYKTTFAVFGFRYVQIETDVEWNTESFTAIAVYSDLQQTCEFSCSNKLINEFFDITLWSAKGNHMDIPTDCPTRERHGWSGDAQIFVGTASYLFDFDTFAKKYVRDLYDWQRKDGKLPQIAPYGGVDFYMKWMNGSVGWSDAGVIIPYTLWKRYGDKRFLAEMYDKMKRYAMFMIKRCGKKIILSRPLHLKHKDRKYIVNFGQCYGEWAEPADVFPNHWTTVVLPNPEVATAYTHYVMSLMTEIAQELGKTEDVALYKKFADGTKSSYQALRRKEDYSLETNRQAMLVRPLYMNLLDDKQTEYAKKRLITALDNYGWRLGTGFLSTPLILPVLADIDVEYAYRLLENEQMPGWLFMPKSGATTVWESWEGTEAQGGIASLNHYSKGAVCEWLVRGMCGINVAGENHFVIAPKVGGKETFAKCEYQSVYGRVSSAWEKKDGKVKYTIEIPSNTTAEITIGGKTQTVGAGRYEFEG